MEKSFLSERERFLCFQKKKGNRIIILLPSAQFTSSLSIDSMCISYSSFSLSFINPISPFQSELKKLKLIPYYMRESTIFCWLDHLNIQLVKLEWKLKFFKYTRWILCNKSNGWLYGVFQSEFYSREKKKITKSGFYIPIVL